MARIYMVRHGQAAHGFGAHADPGLDDVGRSQAAAAAETLAPLGPLPIYSSPLARARETAEPLAARWETPLVIEPRVAEIPSPTDDLRERAAWLRSVMGERWTDLGPDLRAWRQEMVDWVAGRDADSVVFCHFISINVIAGAATGADRMITFRPDNGSITTLAVDAGRIELVELGHEADTRVN